jgi:hypothetical protein
MDKASDGYIQELIEMVVIGAAGGRTGQDAATQYRRLRDASHNSTGSPSITRIRP